eukprot:g13100.t1 g13100   contig70:2000-3376(-)
MLSSIALSLSAVSAAATPMNSLAFLNHRHPLHPSSSTSYRGPHKASHPPITSFPFPSADVSSLRYSNSQFEEVKHEENCTSTSEIGSRRSFLSSATSIAASASTLLGVPSYANAAKGAAEYDLEYYLRDVFMGNNKEGNLPPSNAPPLPPPRTLQGPLLPLLLDDELQTSIPIQELSKITNTPPSTLSEQIKAVRSKVQPAFSARYPWKDELVSDEYYFDLTCYSVWKVASIAIPNDYVKRDEFLRNIGRRILEEAISKEIISKQSIDALSKAGEKTGSTLTSTIPCIIEILNLFQSTNYCSNYRLGDKNDEVRTGPGVFDELDDEELSSSSTGGSVNCLVSIYDPSDLGGALQITGEGSRFAPDFVGPTLAAIWERVGGSSSGSGGKKRGEGVVAVQFESYFVDPVYRPNPKDFFPNERFYQYTIARK